MIKTFITAFAIMLSVSSLCCAQEMLTAGNKKYVVADIEDIKVIYTRPTIADVLARQGNYSLFAEALEVTGLADTLSLINKYKRYSVSDNSAMASRFYYAPTECKVKFTLFAIDDDTFRALGITDFAALKAKCAEWYGDAAWYDYPGKESMAISMGDDYTYTYNVVNMFVRYHILKAGMEYKKLVRTYDPEDETWNFAFGGEPYSYHETLLPHTLMKIWQPLYHNTGESTNIWINRYRKNNTLTDEAWSFGSEAMHPLVDEGALINSGKSDIYALNGYIHNVSKPLIYSDEVAHGVLNERMRVDCVDMLFELANNGIGRTSAQEIGKMNIYNPGEGTMARLPLDYCDNLVANSERTSLAYYAIGPWRAWGSDQIGGWGMSDVSLRLPPVPTGTYEIRIIYPPMAAGPLWQFYHGTSSDTTKMVTLGEPFDAKYPNTSLQEDRQATGYLLKYEFGDYGVESDATLRKNGYMRAPASFSRGTYNYVKTPANSPDDLIATISNCCRYEEGYGTSMLRKILGTVYLEQGKEHWLRFKDLEEFNAQRGFSFDFIELVPVSVVNNPTYTEDWY